MANPISACRITAIVNRDFNPSETVLSTLQSLGVNQMNHVTGRSLILRETGGLIPTIMHSPVSLESSPVEIVSFFVDPSQEDQALSLIIDKFKLNISGSGSIYSEMITLVKDSTSQINKLLVEPESNIRTQSQLMGICCIVVRGQGDRVARVALDTGSCVPTITFGQGAGLRDRLGLWRITIPAEKEIVTMIVNSFEAEEIMNIMIDTARLDQPGRGFIYQFPVNKGLINMKVSQTARSEAASMEQVIIALDELTGGTEWRRRRLATAYNELRRNHLTNLTELALYCDEGSGADYVRIAMDAGASGATISDYRLIFTNETDDNNWRKSPARECCTMIVGPKQVGSIVSRLEEAGAFAAELQNEVQARPVPRAFSYIAK